MYKSILLTLGLTLSVTANAEVRYDVYNNSSSSITLEVKGAGKATLEPNQYTHFIYENSRNPIWERAYSCRENTKYGHVECWLNNQLQAQVNPSWGGECKIEVSRLNQSIVCKDI